MAITVTLLMSIVEDSFSVDGWLTDVNCVFDLDRYLYFDKLLLPIIQLNKWREKQVQHACVFKYKNEEQTICR